MLTLSSRPFYLELCAVTLVSMTSASLDVVSWDTIVAVLLLDNAPVLDDDMCFKI